MRILLIGGTGFIGTPLFKRLHRDHDVTLFHRGKTDQSNLIQQHSIIGDRRDLPSFREQFRSLNPDIVIDMIPLYAQDAWDIINTFSGVCRKVIALSSADVYRAYEILKDNLDSPPYGELTEESDLRYRLFPYKGIDPNNVLMENYEKILVEQLLQNQSAFDVTILRLSALYGEGDKQQKLGDYIKPMLKGDEKITISKDKAHWRWTKAYVQDAAEAIRLAVDHERTGHHVYNVGQKETPSELALIEKLKAITGWQGTIEVTNDEDEDANFRQDWLINSNKIRNELNFREVVDFEQGLQHTIQYIEKQI